MGHVLLALVLLTACRHKAADRASGPEASPDLQVAETASTAPGPSTVREMVDPVGYCTRPDQMRDVVEAARALEADGLKQTARRTEGIVPLAALCPHDDHLYAARVYLHAIPLVARASTVIVFGVTHKAAREALGDPRDVVILDDFEDWSSAMGHVPVDDSLRQAIARGLGPEVAVVSRVAHEKEHSVEGLVPWLAYFNPDVRIVPVMVTAMDEQSLGRVSSSLADAIVSYAREEDLVIGRDLALLVSVDAVHYGPDFGHAPFGTDEAAHEKAVARDVRIGETLLSGVVTEQSVRGFTDEVWGEKITWCGRNSVPLGLLVTARVASRLGAGDVTGIPLRYGDSLTLGVLDPKPEGPGTTAPANLEHWVGYWAIVYGTSGSPAGP